MSIPNFLTILSPPSFYQATINPFSKSMSFFLFCKKFICIISF